MIDSSVILTFDGTIITGLFVFYAFLVVLAERFEKAKLESNISTAIRYLAIVQLVFVISAILVLVEQSTLALISTVIGSVMLGIYSIIMIIGRGLVEVFE
jgi:hypothetical protein